MTSSSSLSSQSSAASANLISKPGPSNPSWRQNGSPRAVERQPVTMLIEADDFRDQAVYRETVQPGDGRELTPTSGWGDLVNQVFQSCGHGVGQWIDSQKRPYPIEDERRILYSLAFAGLGELDRLLLGGGERSDAPLTEFGRLRDSVAPLNEAFDKFIQLRKMEKDAPYKALANLLVSPTRDTFQSHVLREYVLRGAAALVATSGAQFLTSLALSHLVQTVPQSVQDGIVREILGEDAVKDPNALSRALSAAPEHALAKVDGLIGRKIAEELLASDDLTDQGRACLAKVVSEMENFSHPPSTFLNEVKAEPWQSYAIQGTAAGVGQTATTHYNKDAPAVKAAKAMLWSFLAGSAIHLSSRAAQGKMDAGLKELGWNTIFSGLAAIVEPQILDALKKHVKSENDLKFAKVISLAVSRFILKDIKMLLSLAASGGSIDTLGGSKWALARNAGVTIFPTIIKGALDEGLNYWFKRSKENAEDFRFSSLVGKAAEAADGLTAALEEKLSQNDLEPEQREAFSQALAILHDCKRVREWADKWNPSPEAISHEDLTQARDMAVDSYAARAGGSGSHTPLMISEYGSEETLNLRSPSREAYGNGEVEAGSSKRKSE